MKWIHDIAFAILGFSLLAFCGAIAFLAVEVAFHASSEEFPGVVDRYEEKIKESGKVFYSPVYSFTDENGKMIEKKANWSALKHLAEKWVKPGDQITLRYKNGKVKVSSFLSLYGPSTACLIATSLFFVLPSALIFHFTKEEKNQNKTSDQIASSGAAHDLSS